MTEPNYKEKYDDLLAHLKEFYDVCGEELSACYEDAHELLVEILTKHRVLD